MQSHTTYPVPASARGAVIALGNFDGIHLGHQAVIARAKSIADDLGAPLGIGLFRPHPRLFFKPDADPFRLMSAQLRADLLPDYGVDHLFEIPFDSGLRDMDDTTFVQTVLNDGLGVSHVVIGSDYHFGKDRCGNATTLAALCEACGIGVTALTPIGLHEFYGKYGSTQIREALRKGDVFHAAHMLGRPWIVDGVVEEGQKRGRTIGFPTANIAFNELVRPLNGVYVVHVRIPGDDTIYGGVANSGTRPTVGGGDARLEVNIFDYSGDLYGQRLHVAFRSFIRPEQTFDSFDALKDQIAKDAAGAKAVLGMQG